MEKYMNHPPKMRGRSALRYASTSRKRVHEVTSNLGKSFYNKYLLKAPETPVIPDRMKAASYNFGMPLEETRRTGRCSNKGIKDMRKQFAEKSRPSLQFQQYNASREGGESKCLQELHYQLVKAQQNCKRVSKQVDS